MSFDTTESSGEGRVMRYMLDTSICIYAIKHKPREVIERLKEYNPSEICISSLTYAELIHGVESSKAVDKNRTALTLLLTDIEILPFDISAAEGYGEIHVELERKGTPIAPLDMMIAGHARSLGYTVVTNNIKEFERIDGLRLENWVDS